MVSRSSDPGSLIATTHGVREHPDRRDRAGRRLRPLYRHRVAGAPHRTGWPGLDISELMLARAVRVEGGPQIGFLRADAQRLPLRDETVDAVVSIAVLQLVPDPAAALAEMARVLRAGGRLAVMVPAAGFWRMRYGASTVPQRRLQA